MWDKEVPTLPLFFTLYLIVTRPRSINFHSQRSTREGKALIASTPLTLALNPQVQKVTDVCRPTKEKRSFY